MKNDAMKNDIHAYVDVIVSHYLIFKDDRERGGLRCDPATLVISRRLETGTCFITVGAKARQAGHKFLSLESAND